MSRLVRALAPHLPAALVVALFITTGLRGIDFGHHWDEETWQIKPVQAMVSSGVLVPRAYLYPSFARWVVLLPSLATGIEAGREGQGVRAVQATMTAAFDRPDYLVSVRVLFLLICALTLVWIYLAVLVLDGTWWKALIACAAFGLSWEFAYHSRWVAVDCVCTQFEALALLFLALFLRRQKLVWLYCAAIAVGFATGTKYPGVVLLPTVLLAGALYLPRRPVLPQLLRAAGLGFTAFGAYLLTTPGTLINPFDFYEQLRGIDSYYANGHYTFTVEKGLPHLAIAANYFVFTFFSPYAGLAVAGFALAIVGAVLRVRDDRRAGIVLISFPILFLWFFCWRYRVFIARNYLVIAPFLTVLLVRGASAALDRLKTLKARQIATAVLLVPLALHAAWLVEAGESIRHRDPLAQAREAIEFVRDRPASTYRVSQRVKQLAQQQGMQLPSNVRDDGTHVVFFIRAEGPDPIIMAVNDPWLVEATFGPGEVNMNWYSSWDGNDRVVVMKLDKARATSVPLAR